MAACRLHHRCPVLCLLPGITHRTAVHSCRPVSPAMAIPSNSRRQLHLPGALPFAQAWGSSVDLTSESLQANIFASSIVPYSAFLYFLQKSGKAPKLTMFGFYFLLVFVGATIPAGIWAKVHYQSSLSNVDWLHGTAESTLTLTNLFIVLGLRQGIREAEKRQRQDAQQAQHDAEESVRK